MTYEAILFDMDGVIIDTKESVNNFWNNIAIEDGQRITKRDFDQYVYGCTAVYTLNMLFPHFTQEQRELVLSKMEVYETKLQYRQVNGVTSFIKSLKSHNLFTALVTSGKEWKVNQAKQQLGINGLFDAEVTADEVHDSKPSPECYILAANILKIPSEKCLVFEDAISGVQAAVASRATCIGLETSVTSQALYNAGAKYVIPDFESVKVYSDYYNSSYSPVQILRLINNVILRLESCC